MTFAGLRTNFLCSLRPREAPWKLVGLARGGGYTAQMSKAAISRFSWVCVLAGCACGPKEPASSASTASSTEAATPATTTSTSTTSTWEPDPGLEVDDFARCGADASDPACILSDDTCICGPGCNEFGPAGVPGRCPLGEFQALCPGDTGVPYVCIISCTTDADCPDPEMVCRPCPEPFVHACTSLGYWGAPETPYNWGPDMCTWPILSGLPGSERCVDLGEKGDPCVAVA